MNDSIRSRFYEKILITDKNGCMRWIAGKFPNGYGCFKLNGKSVGAHRLSYQIHKGDIPPEMCICHKCDNKWCVNPLHLFIGTINDNVQDKVKKGRSVFGSKNGRTKLTEKDVIEIRKEINEGIDQRIIAKKYKIGQTTVSHIKQNQTWRHI